MPATTPQFDHLGIAVRDLDAAVGFYAQLGIYEAGRQVIENEQVAVAMLPLLAGGRIELMAATDPDSPVGRFLARRGEGLHHVALRVPDLSAAVARLKQSGVRFVGDKIQSGAGGHRYIFAHPATTHGVLIELIEDARPGTA